MTETGIQHITLHKTSTEQQQRLHEMMWNKDKHVSGTSNLEEHNKLSSAPVQMGDEEGSNWPQLA